MKRFYLIGAALGAVGGLCMLTAPTASAAGSPLFAVNGITPNTTVTITLTGYCDTFTLNVPSVGNGLAHSLDGTHNLIGPCGGTEDYYDIGWMAGGVAAAGEDEDGINVLYIFKNDGTWSNYYDCGFTAPNGTECFFLSGTWTYGPQQVGPQGRRPGKSSLPNK